MSKATRNKAPALRVTERDLDILDALATHRFLSARQVAALCFPSIATAQGRLRRLAQHNLVVTVFLPVRPYSNKSETIYALAAAGSQLLRPRHDGRRLSYLSPSERRSGLFLDHTLRRNDLHIQLELLDRDRNRALRLLNWQQAKDEVRFTTAIKGPRQKMGPITVVPDATIAVLSSRGHQAFAVEIDNATVAASKMLPRFRGYWKWWRQRGPEYRWGPMPMRVLTLVPDQRRLQRLLRIAMDAPENADQGQGSGLFWFATHEALDVEHPERILDAVWSVARRGQEETQPLFAS